MDLQLTSGNTDEATLRDVCTQSDLGTDTPRLDRTITVIHAPTNHSNRQDADDTAKARTRVNTSSTTQPGQLTSDGGSSSSKHGDRQKTAADGELGDAEISLHTKPGQPLSEYYKIFAARRTTGRQQNRTPTTAY